MPELTPKQAALVQVLSDLSHSIPNRIPRPNIPANGLGGSVKEGGWMPGPVPLSEVPPNSEKQLEALKQAGVLTLFNGFVILL